jgi:hypothetical protein
MKRYQHLIGTRLEVQYRAGEYHLSTAGILVADSGKSIFVQENFCSGGKPKTLRVEIPYSYVIRITEMRTEDSLR